MSKQSIVDEVSKSVSLRHQFNHQICDFIDRSPTPFHAVQNMAQLLDEAEFIVLQEGDSWVLESGKQYYVVRNQSSIIAWTQGHQSLVERGFQCLAPIPIVLA